MVQAHPQPELGLESTAAGLRHGVLTHGIVGPGRSTGDVATRGNVPGYIVVNPQILVAAKFGGPQPIVVVVVDVFGQPQVIVLPSDPGRRLLYGRYIGQITARIERAWMRPRTPIDDVAFFACRVRVTQDRRGIVQEIELVRCNGTPRWQTSVVQAIQSASPLPAPPDADVYTSQITLDLQSATFTPGASAEGFEPEVSVAAGTQAIGR